MRAEYDYLALGSKSINNVGSFTCAPAAGGGCTPSTIVPPGRSGVSQDVEEFKIGLNYRWGVDPRATWPLTPAATGLGLFRAPRTLTADWGGWEVEGGGRYVGSWGQFHKDPGFFPTDPVPPLESVSRLTYNDMQTNSGEFFARIETPWNFFVKGFIGGGVTGNGT